MKCLLPLGAALNIWHGFEGFLDEKFNEVIDCFNKSQKEHVVTTEKKGNYREVVELGMTTDHPPHLLQVYEVAIMDHLEKIFHREETVQEGLDLAVIEGNALLEASD